MNYGFMAELEAEWGPRSERASQVCDRVVKMFLGMSPFHQDLAQWRTAEYNESRSKPLDLTDPNNALETVKKNKSVSDRDPGKELPGGGFMFGGWNGLQGNRSVGFRISCGSTSDAVNNSFSLSFSSSFPLMRKLASMVALVHLTVEVWEPDFCWISDRTHQKAPEGHMWYRNLNAPEMGWLVYVKDMQLSRRTVPSAAEVIPMGGSGSLIVASKKPIERANPANAELLERIREEAGIPESYTLDRWPKRRRLSGR